MGTLDGWLQDNEHWLVALILVAVLVLVYQIMVEAKGKRLSFVDKEGMAPNGYAVGSNLALRAGSIRDDGGAAANVVTKGVRHEAVEGLGGNEPPVMWNIGDVAATRQYAAGAAQVPAEGLKARADYTENMTAGNKVNGQELSPW